MPTPTLSTQQQHIAAIAALTAIGDIPKLHTALNVGLEAGLTVNQAKDILVQMYAYAGFPRSLNGLSALMDVLKERQAKGIHDPAGKAATPTPPGADMLARGTAVQTQLSGAPVQGPLFEFAPAIDRYLKVHLFGEIFASDVLSYQEREVATIAALAALRGVASQLKAHFRIGRHVGLSDLQLQGIIAVVREQVGADEGRTAEQAWREFSGA